MLNIARSRRQRRQLEWVLLSIALIALVVWLSTSGHLKRANHLVQDAGLRLAARPSHPDIVVVAIDDRSIAAIGHWPLALAPRTPRRADCTHLGPETARDRHGHAAQRSRPGLSRR